MAAPRKILICEDEDAIREFEVINLQRSGYEVVDVSCGEDAIRVFDEQGDSFSVAILDIMMPGIDGLPSASISGRKIIPWASSCFPPKARRWTR